MIDKHQRARSSIMLNRACLHLLLPPPKINLRIFHYLPLPYYYRIYPYSLLLNLCKCSFLPIMNPIDSTVAPRQDQQFLLSLFLHR